MTALAVAALFVLGYTYAGYPLLVALCARLVTPRAPRTGVFEPTVSVCIAVHDGAAHLLDKLESLLALDYPPRKLEILVYSDGSSDETEQIARVFAAHEPRVRVFAGAARLGKPAALNRLHAEARGEVLLMTDVRQPLNAPSLRAMLRALADPEVGCVSGSLVLRGNTGASAYWRYEKFIRNCEARIGGMVGVSGSLYLVRRADFEQLPEHVLLDDMIVPLRVARRKKRTVLSAEAEAYDEAYDDDREFARKVRTLAGNYQLLQLMPWLLVPGKNPVWFQMVSHKLLRLVCPWALLALLVASVELAQVSSLWLPLHASHALWQSIVFAQLFFYGLAALGARAGRFGALARTFVVLNAAAVVGLWRFLRGSQAVTW